MSKVTANFFFTTYPSRSLWPVNLEMKKDSFAAFSGKCRFSTQGLEVFLTFFRGFPLIISKVMNGSLCFAKELTQKVVLSRKTNELKVVQMSYKLENIGDPAVSYMKFEFLSMKRRLVSSSSGGGSLV